jgi:hypothetical protein
LSDAGKGGLSGVSRAEIVQLLVGGFCAQPMMTLSEPEAESLGIAMVLNHEQSDSQGGHCSLLLS